MTATAGRELRLIERQFTRFVKAFDELCMEAGRYFAVAPAILTDAGSVFGSPIQNSVTSMGTKFALHCVDNFSSSDPKLELTDVHADLLGLLSRQNAARKKQDAVDRKVPVP